MAFLTTETIAEQLTGCFRPYDPSRISHGAYQLSLGPDVYLTTEATKTRLELGQQFSIQPGQFALLLSEESVSVPADLLGFISIRAGIKFHGLINVSGFHVDPGFRGRLKFTVYNAGSTPIVLARGEPLFPIWFCRLDRRTNDVYRGRFQGQEVITGQDVQRLQGELASPALLKERLDKVEHRLGVLQAITIPLFVALLILLLNLLFQSRHEPSRIPTSPQSDIRNSGDSK